MTSFAPIIALLSLVAAASALAEDRSAFPDALMVPAQFRTAIRQAVPLSVIDDPQCANVRTTTTCKVSFWWAKQANKVQGECLLLFRGAEAESVWENASCRTDPPADVSVVRNNVLNVFLIYVGVAAAEARGTYVNAITNGETVREAVWEMGPNVNGGFFAKRAYEVVTKEHAQRFRKGWFLWSK